MSSTSKFKAILKNKRTKLAVIPVGVAGALVAAMAIAPASGAYFTASDDGTISQSAATLNLDLSDNHGNTGTFKLAFDNIAPGVDQIDRFSVKNTGTIPADVTLSLGGFTGSGNPSDPNQLKIAVENFVDYQPFFNQGAGSSIKLGTLQPGQTYQYTVHERLDAAANDTWQGVKGSAVATVKLEQQH